MRKRSLAAIASAAFGAGYGSLATVASAQTPIHARFDLCGSGPRVTCVVDGDTFWLEGTKIRIADINTPETSQPGCAAEAELGARATRRLVQLLNAGPFMLEVQGRATDRYGRALRVVTRKGSSLAESLVAEGLAERWTGRRGDWCAAS
ncbi:thermonuclease family protein [Novosphingobium sp. ERN07]|uniref:thermonuclease family protein n=1 Tax=Novosphingobium sp. ERN07 TaxID=2726187 RepID=UPI001456BA69|nr:thermonuclease family protein [Novosphingobium sp. ERN07]NLR73058.1 thermonuclease family protein [Novosphingobium sp. ERN07]